MLSGLRLKRESPKDEAEYVYALSFLMPLEIILSCFQAITPRLGAAYQQRAFYQRRAIF